MRKCWLSMPPLNNYIQLDQIFFTKLVSKLHGGSLLSLDPVHITHTFFYPIRTRNAPKNAPRRLGPLVILGFSGNEFHRLLGSGDHHPQKPPPVSQNGRKGQY